MQVLADYFFEGNLITMIRYVQDIRSVHVLQLFLKVCIGLNIFFLNKCETFHLFKVTPEVYSL